MAHRLLLRIRLALNLLVVRVGMRGLVRRGELIEGRGFFVLLRALERECAARSDLALVVSGEKAPRCYSQLGTVLSLLDQLSSCMWGCRGGDHVAEYLVGRAVGDLRAAINLMRLGYYDESLSLTRNAGEVANLLHLFDQDATAFADWKALPSNEGWREYRPVRVRSKLKALGGVLVAQDRYARLSEVATHVTPRTRPQAHNPFGVPSQGPVFQLAGALIALNEAALVASLITIPATGLIDHGAVRRRSVLDEAMRLAEQLGGANILEVEDYYEKVREAAAASNEPGGELQS